VVFAGKAFVDTTMEDVARAAGVTRVTVYAHFPGKGDIMDRRRPAAGSGGSARAAGRLPLPPARSRARMTRGMKHDGMVYGVYELPVTR
jgi:hypothetical protein